MATIAWIAGLLGIARAADFEDLVADPTHTLLADADTPKGFRIVALSHAAEACVGRARDGEMPRDDARACVDRMAASATSATLSPWGVPVAEVRDFGEHGLFVSHLAIVLGARDALHDPQQGDPPVDAADERLHSRVVDHLHRAALAQPTGIGRSFPSATYRWPADQAATLYGMWLYDRAHGTHVVDAPLARYLAGVPSDALPPSEATGDAPDAELPRGCALSFTVRYLAAVAPDYARFVWADMAEEGFVVRMGPLAGVREWPVGVERPADIDSGPIVNGIGASATAFGWLAARAVGDTRSASAFGRTAALGDLAVHVSDAAAAAAQSALAESITALGEVEAPIGATPR